MRHISFLFLPLLAAGHDHSHEDCTMDHRHHDSSCGGVRNEHRECPDGYFYGGETVAPESRGLEAEKGPASPVYSCYSVHRGAWDWATATRRCVNEPGATGQLLSVNNYREDPVLTGDLFLKRAFTVNGTVVLPTEGVLSSGISLAEGQWTWFGAGDGDDDPTNVNNTIIENINNNATTDTFTSCLTISFVNKTVGTNTTNVVLSYTAEHCINNFTLAVCEVRVYEQIWYVWFTTNWLQILFLLTLVLLLVSSCATFQIWVSRPNRRAGSIPRPSGAPPAYSREEPQGARARLAATTEKYTDKGKDILAKVVFYKKPEDKQRLEEDA